MSSLSLSEKRKEKTPFDGEANTVDFSWIAFF